MNKNELILKIKDKKNEIFNSEKSFEKLLLEHYELNPLYQQLGKLVIDKDLL